MRLPIRRAKNTKKENQCLRGLRFLALMEAITEPVMKLMLQEVKLMMFDHYPEQNFYPKCTLFNPPPH
uniref:Protein yippee n=1 Tax=Solanum tuberosum TaxID=4113 RepID=M1AV89_SOLTU